MLTIIRYNACHAWSLSTATAITGPRMQPREKEPCNKPCATFGRDILLAQLFHAISVKPLPRPKTMLMANNTGNGGPVAMISAVDIRSNGETAAMPLNPRRLRMGSTRVVAMRYPSSEDGNMNAVVASSVP